jgi:hypothetical protein
MCFLLHFSLFEVFNATGYITFNLSEIATKTTP